MNFYVANPDWAWLITLYFFLGGIAAGAYFMAALIDLLGSGRDHDLARAGYWIAFPLISVCGILLIADLGRPERFWHMMFRSEQVEQAFADGWPLSGPGWRHMAEAPLLKTWSPMSAGSWALLLFGLCSGLSFLGSLRPGGRLERRLRHGILGRALQVVGSLVGFFVAAYTGSLLTATNEPVWSDSVWVAPLFLTSAASTGIAAILLLGRRRNLLAPDVLLRLERADLWALGLELAMFAIFAASLGGILLEVLGTWHGKILLLGTLILGLLLPLGIHLRLGLSGRWSMPTAAVLVLVGGFLLRYGILTTPPEILSRGPSVLAGFSPEDGRQPGRPGADPGNRRD